MPAATKTRPCQHCNRPIHLRSVNQHERLCPQNPDRQPRIYSSTLAALQKLADAGGRISGDDYPRGQVPARVLGLGTNGMIRLEDEGWIDRTIQGKRTLALALTDRGRQVVEGDGNVAVWPNSRANRVRTSAPTQQQPRRRRLQSDSVTSAVLDYLNTHGSATTPELVDALGAKERAVTSALGRLHNRGDARRRFAGLYEPTHRDRQATVVVDDRGDEHVFTGRPDGITAELAERPEWRTPATPARPVMVRNDGDQHATAAKAYGTSRELDARVAAALDVVTGGHFTDGLQLLQWIDLTRDLAATSHAGAATR